MKRYLLLTCSTFALSIFALVYSTFAPSLTAASAPTPALVTASPFCALSKPMAQATTLKGHTPAVASNHAPIPDLIVYWVAVGDPKSGKFEIRIKNTGTATAGWSYVVLKVYHVSSPGAKPKEMSYHATVPGIGIGQYADVIIETKLNLTLDTSCGIADGTNRIVESNEVNNRNCGPVDS
ncbi:MAG TPA: CARDB domain-containing protein [Pyrinomonadaceae bacterium]|nr:CARDB domain-containing protein [Pyrinomonadaceae bacterium]